MTAPRTAFISGHTDLDQAEFDRIYIPKIDAALDAGDRLLLGDATGVDTQALDYLLSPEVGGRFPDVAQRIVIYASKVPSIKALQARGVEVISPKDASLAPTPEAESLVGFENKGRDRARFKYALHDAHLTLKSDYDILYARSEEESRVFYGSKYRPRLSATEINRRRREILTAKVEERPPPKFEFSAWETGEYEAANEDESRELLEEMVGV